MENPNVVISEFSALIERHFGDFHINLHPSLLKLHQQSTLLMVLSISIPVGILSPNDEQKKIANTWQLLSTLFTIPHQRSW